MRAELTAMMHRLNHPMADILDKIPGDTLTARAKAIGVSRQTMYVWAQEQFRPGRAQAEIIANLTGVPVGHILPNGYEEGEYDGVKKPTRKKTARLAKAVKKLPRSAARLRAKRTGMVAEQGKRRYARTDDKRSPRRPSGGASD